MTPLISIVTVCYNSERTIAKTIESVLEQDLSMIEYLIIDGSSTDNTLQVINQYVDDFKGYLRVISEPDNGWYDAMNKGVKYANGEFVVFLNSDDYFDHDAIKNVVEEINNQKIDCHSIIYGDSTNVYQNTKGEVLFRKIKAPNHVSIHDKKLKDGMCGIRHQSMFTGKAVFGDVGLLDLQYRLHADWDFLVKCIKNNVHMVHINHNLTFYSMYGASTRPDSCERHRLRVNNDLCGDLDWNYIKDRWGIKVILKSILGEKQWNDLLFYYHKKCRTIRKHD